MTARFVPTREDPPIQVLATPARDRLTPTARLWRVLAVCVLMARTNRAAAMPVWPALFDRFPDPVLLADAGGRSLSSLPYLLEPLGFQHRRARLLHNLARAVAWDPGAPAILTGRAPVEDLPGCGAYAREAFDLFVRGDLTAEPTDHVLAEWRRVLLTVPVDGDRRTRHDRDRRQAPRPRHRGPQPRRDHMSATAAPVRPRDLDVGQTAVVDLDGQRRTVVVLANNPKAGRVKLEVLGGAATRSATYKALGDVELVDQPAPEPPAPQEPTPPPPTHTRSAPTQRVLDALTDHGPLVNGEPWTTHLTAEQADRALEAGSGKRGLRGKALAEWVLTGESPIAAAAAAPKPKRPRAGTSRASAYSPEVRAAVKAAKEISGGKMAPGPKQLVAVIAAVDRMVAEDDGLAKDVTDALSATGFKSLKSLKAFAAGEGGKLTEQTDLVRARMRMLFEASGSDPFARGKALAALVAAHVDTQRAAK